MDRKLGCRFVGYGEKAEKSPYSSAPSCPLGTIRDLIGLTSARLHCSDWSEGEWRYDQEHRALAADRGGSIACFCHRERITIMFLLTIRAVRRPQVCAQGYRRVSHACPVIQELAVRALASSPMSEHCPPTQGSGREIGDSPANQDRAGPYIPERCQQGDPRQGVYGVIVSGRDDKPAINPETRPTHRLVAAPRWARSRP